MTKTAIIRMIENQPQIIYIGNKETAEAKLFRIILNSETPFVKKLMIMVLRWKSLKHVQKFKVKSLFL